MKKTFTPNPTQHVEGVVTKNLKMEIKTSYFQNDDELYSPIGRGMSVYEPSSMGPGRYDRSGSLYEAYNPRNRGASVIGNMEDYSELNMSIGNSSPRLKSNNEKKLTSPNYAFVEREAWIDDKNCFVCDRSFKRVESHHCRSCGHGVCGDCGEKEINERRVCDICFKKEKFKYTEIARNLRYQKLEEQVSYKKAELKRLQRDLEMAKKNNQKYIHDGHGTDGHHQMNKERLEKNKERENKKFERAQIENTTFKTEIESASDITKKKEAKLSEIKMQTAALKLQVNQKLTILQNKEKAVEALRVERHLMNETNGSVSAYSDYSSSCIVNPRNFSLADNNGVYSLSSQPYKI